MYKIIYRFFIILCIERILGDFAMLRKSKYHIFYEISEIDKLINSKWYDRLIPTFSASAMKVYLHQTAETMFALNSNEKG